MARLGPKFPLLRRLRLIYHHRWHGGARDAFALQIAAVTEILTPVFRCRCCFGDRGSRTVMPDMGSELRLPYRSLQLIYSSFLRSFIIGDCVGRWWRWLHINGQFADSVIAFDTTYVRYRYSWQPFPIYMCIRILLLTTGSIADTCVTRGSVFLFPLQPNFAVRYS